MSGKKRLADLSVDEFFSGGFDSGSESDQSPTKSKRNRNKKKAKKVNPAVIEDTKTKGKPQPTGKSKKGIVSKHKETLSQLKDQDPEFFEFLKDEDESLLKFGDMSGSDISDSSDNDDDGADKLNDSNDDDEDDDKDDEIDFPLSSDEEMTPANIAKFLEKKNEAEIEKLKKKALESPPPKRKQTEKKVNAEKKADKKKVEQQRKKIEKELKEQAKNADESSDDEDSDDDDDIDSNDGDDNDDKDLDIDMDASDDSDEEMFHKPPQELEVMSDSNSDDDDDDDDDSNQQSGKKIKVTEKMVKEWTKRFKDGPSPSLIQEAVNAFKAAVQHTATESVSSKYKVEGATVYNAVVRMCLVELPGALQKTLNLPVSDDLQKPVLPSSKTKRWNKVKMSIKSYLTDVIQLMSSLSETKMVDVLLKHIHRMVVYYACFQKHTKTVLKKVIDIWSSGEETSRVLAFLVINRLIRINQEQNLENCVKQMYMAYVRNCKFTSPNTLPLINFMQRSYIEILALDYVVAYQYAFVYIRQLAIHLRNAVTLKKKESYQAVYNWQYIHCLTLWSHVLSTIYPNDTLQPLLYPLIQTIIGTIKLIPTQRYYPLRFHCVKALTAISKSTNTFIPVLPFLLEVFEQTDFNRKHKSMSLKPFSFATILKLSKTQLQDKAFKDGVLDQLCELLIEQFHAYSNSISFPELVLPALLQLKEFLKKCKVGNFTKQIKQIVEKIDENSKHITKKRRTVNINLSDTQAITRWEKDCEAAGTPLDKFYNTWRKVRDRELIHRIAAKDQVVDVELPKIKRTVQQQKATDEDKKEFSALFDSDSDNEDTDFTESFLPPAEKKKLMRERKAASKEKLSNKKDNKTDDNDDDDDIDDDDDVEDDEAIYEDFDSDELEQLAGSGDDDEDDDDVDYDDGKQSDDDSDEDENSNNDDDDEDDDGIPDKEDIVKEFTMSSDEDSD
ncbi:Nucleolar complex protein 2 [Mactra antiquata]